MAVADEKLDPINWWKTHKQEFPLLSSLAHNYLAIMATSVPCEQLFSIAGLTITKTRNRLNSDSVRACLCFKSWYNQNFEV